VYQGSEQVTEKRGNGLFITGTDTGVGKTVVAAGLTRLARTRGIRALAIKPVETGCALQEGVLYPEDGALLREAGERELTLDECAPLRFTLPSSPARAAAAEGRPIDVQEIENHVRGVATRADLVVVEGAGGLMVPIRGSIMMIDLIEQLGYPALLVSRTRLGTINHTLLSVHALRNRGIAIAGIVLSASSPDTGQEEAYTPADIARLAPDVPVAVLPYLTPRETSDASVVAAIMEREILTEVWRGWIGPDTVG
jgi:dethiobiotin synthetase